MRIRVIFILFLTGMLRTGVVAQECDNWHEEHPEWIFCDDFEDTGALVKPGRYFEYGDNDGDFVNIDGVGLDGSHGMRVRFQEGEVGAGGFKVAFGRNPNSYMNKQQIRPDEDFREIYYRMYLKMEEGWSGCPAKLSRATCFTSAADWRQAMIAHLWSDDEERLLIDPARCIDNNGNVLCTKYNDFEHLDWLGMKSGVTPIFSTEYSDRWFCIEAHVKLNDPGQSNGLQEFWIDGHLEARREGLNFIGTYDEYAINAVFFENYWNSGSVKLQERYFDNIVISTEPIGPVAGAAVKHASQHREKGSAVTFRVLNNGRLQFSSYRLITRLILYTISGKIITYKRAAASHTVTFENVSLPGGIYLYRIFFSDEKKITGSTKGTRFQSNVGTLVH